jgi:hypothetical protein
MEHAVGESTITIEHANQDNSVMTEVGPLQVYGVRLATPTFEHSGRLALAGRSHDVDDLLFAVIVEHVSPGPGCDAGVSRTPVPPGRGPVVARRERRGPR